MKWNNKKILYLLLCLMLLVLVEFSRVRLSWSGLEKGLTVYQRGEYKVAFKEFQVKKP